MDAVVKVFRPEVFYFLVALFLLNIAAITLIYNKRAPNLVVGAAFVFALMTALMQFGRRGSIWALLGAGLAGGLAVFFYLRGYLGAGDVKLLVATGTLLGPIQIFYALSVAIVVLLLVDVVSIKWSPRQIDKSLVTVPLSVRTSAAPSPLLRIPCGVAVVLGANLSFGIRYWLG